MGIYAVRPKKGGGFKHFFLMFAAILENMIQYDSLLQIGWNQQLVYGFHLLERFNYMCLCPTHTARRNPANHQKDV